MGQALSWLLETLQEPSADNVVAFRSPNIDRTATGSDLVRQASSLIAAAEDIAREAVTRARLLLERELQMTQQFNDWFALATAALERARAHLTTVDLQLDDAERRAASSEQREVLLMDGLSRIEEALQKSPSNFQHRQEAALDDSTGYPGLRNPDFFPVADLRW